MTTWSHGFARLSILLATTTISFLPGAIILNPVSASATPASPQVISGAIVSYANLWDSEAGTPPWVYQGHESGNVSLVAISGDKAYVQVQSYLYGISGNAIYDVASVDLSTGAMKNMRSIDHAYAPVSNMEANDSGVFWDGYGCSPIGNGCYGSVIAAGNVGWSLNILNWHPGQLAASNSRVFVVDGTSRIASIDAASTGYPPNYGWITAPISVSNIALQGNQLWIANNSGHLFSMDISTGTFTDRGDTGLSSPVLATDADSVWVAGNQGASPVIKHLATDGSFISSIYVASHVEKMKSVQGDLWFSGSASLNILDEDRNVLVASYPTETSNFAVSGLEAWTPKPSYSSLEAFTVQTASVPDPPTITSATRGNAQATVAWTDGASNGSAITSQTIYVYSGASLVSTKTNCSGSPCTVTGLSNGTSYTFKVSDTNDVGEGAQSDPSSAVTPAAVPSAPAITSATRGNTQATIAWTDGSSNGSAISSQTIYIYSGGSLVSTKTNCSASPCTVTGLTNGTSYTFKVSDTNDVGEGALSSASSAVTPATYPGAPQNVTVVAAGGQAVVSWTPPTSNGGSSIISYSVSTGAHSCSYTISSPETDTCTITGLTNGSSYTFSVTATNGVGTGSTSTGGPATVLFPAPVLTSAVAGVHQVKLTWTAPMVTDGKIVIFTGSASDGHGHNFYCSGAKSATKCTITGLTDLMTYTTSVKATENKGGTISASSNTISATPAEPLTLPYLHPVTLTSNPHTVTIVWGSASGGDGQTPTYRLKVFNSDGSTFYSTQTTGNTATASGLTKGTKYTYTITTSTDASVAGWIPTVTTKAVKFTAK